MRIEPNPYNWRGISLELFYGRWDELRAILRGLDKGESFAIVGGRKIGKTTLLRKIEEELRNQFEVAKTQGFLLLPVYLDTLSFPFIFTPRYLYLQVIEKAQHELEQLQLLEKQGEPYADLFDRFLDEENIAFREAVLDLIAQIAPRCSVRIAVMIDEIEKILCTEWGQGFFDNWRSLLTDPDLFPRRSVVLLLSGAKEIKAITEDIGSPLSNVLSWKELKLFAEDESRKLIDEPTQNKLSADVVREILRQTDGHPFLIQYLMEYICDFDLDEGRRRLEEALAKFYEEQDSQFRSWWDEKLDENDRKVYSLLADRREQGLPKSDIVRLVGDTIANNSLAVLCHMGIVRKIDREETYRVAGEMFYTWFVENATPFPRLPNHVAYPREEKWYLPEHWFERIRQMTFVEFVGKFILYGFLVIIALFLIASLISQILSLLR